jgi:geranyl-CoA carboxylase alpha subunit
LASITAVGTNGYSVALGKDVVAITIEEQGDSAVRFTAMGVQQTARFVLRDGVLHLDLNGVTVTARETTREMSSAARRDGSLRVLAPMNGAIIAVFAKPGDRVSRGQRVLVLEAMKMQHEISAERDGAIDRVLVKPGDQVATRQLLIELKAETVAVPQQPEETP